MIYFFLGIISYGVFSHTPCLTTSEFKDLVNQISNFKARDKLFQEYLKEGTTSCSRLKGERLKFLCENYHDNKTFCYEKP